MWLVACGDSTPSGNPPRISWAMTGARFRVLTDEVLSLVPDIENADEATTFRWTMNGATVGTENHFEFSSHEAGEYFIQLLVTNRFGQCEDEVKVTVVESEGTTIPQLPPDDGQLRWAFPFTEINIPLGRDIEIAPSMVENGTATRVVFQGNSLGDHRVPIQIYNDSVRREVEVLVHVCPPAGTYRRSDKGRSMASEVFEYQPAPGHQVNGYIIIGDAFPPGCTHAQACDTVLAHFSRQWLVSLGGWGGYLVAGFDHSVPRTAKGSELCIKGNPYDYQSEPGIIWVSQDVNGDGLPNDLWYELAGSEYGTDRHRTGYAITYFRPDQAHMGVAWKGSDGETDYIPYLSYWNPNDYYWQDWQMERPTLTFCGSRLASNVSYSNGVSSLPPYEWGYADNLGSDYRNGSQGMMGYYSISNARTWDGKPAELAYIDFVKVQSAITGHTPNLGEASTEVYCIMAPQ
ncbi:MAG: hypothetical protein K5945_11265 [Bacteroidaceae bacterium]|nr:hypothetical protein [Bacteroidaceae bacterium]